MPLILTIAIPTYNRAAKLQTQLDLLVPQLCDGVELCVFDNASPDGTKDVVEKYASSGVSYFGAAINGGAGWNFSRCLEKCQGEWLWMLSDDDPACPSAVADILALLRHQTCDFIHTYSFSSPYTKERIISDLPSFFQHTNIGALTWISAGIYRMKSFRPLFRVFNEGISSWSPQGIMVLTLMESHSGKVFLSPLKLTNPPFDAIAWSTLDGLFRLSLIPEFLTHPDNQRMAADRVLLDLFDDFLLDGLREATNRQNIQKWQRICSQVRRNMKAYRAGGVWSFVFRNFYRSGLRKIACRIAIKAVKVSLLEWCPPVLFHSLVTIMPLPANVRSEYNRRREFVAYF